MLDLRSGKEMVADCLGDTRCRRKGSELRRRNSDKIMSSKSDGPTVRWLCWGVGVRLRATRAPGEHVACWEYPGRQDFEHTSMLPVGGCWVTKLSSHLHPASSLEGSVHSPHACRPQTKWDLHKTDSVGISSSRTQFHQPQRLLMAVSWYILTPWYVWLIDIIFDFYMEYLELLVSRVFHSWFTQYKQMKEAMCCFPTSYSSCSWDYFYIQAYSRNFWFFREQRSPV